MTDIRELLDGVEKRAPKAMDEFSAVTDEADSPELWRLLMDTAHMHAALRVVLDDCDVADRLTQGEGAALVSTTRIRQGIAIALGGGA